MKINYDLTPENLRKSLDELWKHSARKIDLIRLEYDTSQGSPVFTEKGKYTTRGWTEWTQGFQFGSEIIQFDATGEKEFLDLGRSATLQFMAPHLTHTGVHDHGFNNVSTYGALFNQKNIDSWEKRFYGP